MNRVQADLIQPIIIKDYWICECITGHWIWWPNECLCENWARFIQKIYEVDPLTCPKCSGQMKVISVIEDEDVIKKILKHLKLWDQNPPQKRRVKARPPPKPSAQQKTHEYRIDYSESQLPAFTRHHSGGSDMWLYVDYVYQED